jgi:stage IV sporulation protein FB
MFGSLQTTHYDLRFHLFGIPVNVTPWFWLGSLLLASGLLQEGRYDLLVLAIACLFVSILVHEMGHALTAKSFGWPPEVFLYQFGGLAVFRPGYGYTTARSVLISFMGPAAGFMLYGLTLIVKRALLPTLWFHSLEGTSQLRVLFVIHQMEWINLWWGLVNLLPVLPLDGGRIAESLLQRARPYDGRSLAVKLSIAVAGAMAIYFYQQQDVYAAILFGLLCVSNVQSLQQPTPW